MSSLLIARQAEAEATRRIALGCLAAIGVLAIGSWPLDFWLFEFGSPRQAVAGIYRVQLVLVVVLARALLRRARSQRWIYAAWVGAYLALTVLSFSVIGAVLGSASPYSRTAVLVPFGTIILVSSIRLRAGVALVGGLGAIVTIAIVSPGAWGAYPSRALLLNYVCVAWTMALMIGQLLTEVVRAQTRASTRVAELIERQNGILRTVSREMRVRLALAWQALSAVQGEDCSPGGATDLLEEMLGQLEDWADDLLAHVRPDAASADPLDAVAVRDVLGPRVGIWNSTRAPVRVDGVEALHARVLIRRRAFLRVVEPLLQQALRSAEHRVTFSDAGEDRGFVKIRIAHDGPGCDSTVLDLRLALSRRIAENAGATCEVVAGSQNRVLQTAWPAASRRPDGRRPRPSPTAWMQAWWGSTFTVRELELGAHERALTAWIGSRFAAASAVAVLLMWPSDPVLFGLGTAEAATFSAWRLRMLPLLLLCAAGLAVSPSRRWNPHAVWIAFFAAISSVSFRALGTGFPVDSPVQSMLWLMPFSICFLIAPLPVRIGVCAMGVGVGMLSLAAADPVAWAGRTDRSSLSWILMGTSVGALWFGHVIRGLLRVNHERALDIDRRIASQHEFLQAVSHEIRTPLARSRFRLEALEGAESEPARDERARALATQLDELGDLVEEMSSYAEGGGRDRSARAESFDLAHVLERCRQDWVPTAGSVVLTGFGTVQNLRVNGSRKDFVRVLGNLVRNGVRYAQSEIQVLAVAEGDGTVRIEVLDDGPGIPAAERGRIFEPFDRLDASRSRETGGIGLGLAIARRIVEQHGGTIRVDSSSAGGARFVIRWPLARAGQVDL